MTKHDARPFIPEAPTKSGDPRKNAMLSKGGSGGFAADPGPRRSSEQKSKPQGGREQYAENAKK